MKLRRCGYGACAAADFQVSTRLPDFNLWEAKKARQINMIFVFFFFFKSGEDCEADLEAAGRWIESAVLRSEGANFVF